MKIINKIFIDEDNWQWDFVKEIYVNLITGEEKEEKDFHQTNE